MFVYKHIETIEYVKSRPTFEEKIKLHGKIAREFLELKMLNFQSYCFYLNTNI